VLLLVLDAAGDEDEVLAGVRGYHLQHIKMVSDPDQVFKVNANPGTDTTLHNF
jgi:hypothetical protein